MFRYSLASFTEEFLLQIDYGGIIEELSTLAKEYAIIFQRKRFVNNV